MSLRDLLRDVAGLAGAALVAWGLWDVYPPAAKVAVGVAIFWIALHARTL